MSGLGGHMNHPYDNPNLSFGVLKKMIIDISDGNIKQVTEKLDGMNLFFTYSIKDGKIKGARNKTEKKSGGLDIVSMGKKFEGRGLIHDSFVISMESLQRVIESTDDLNTLIKLFGDSENYNIFYSMEVINPKSPNVVIYNTECVIIHRVGVVQKYNVDFQVEPDMDSNIDVMDEMIKTSQDNIKDQLGSDDKHYNVSVNPIFSISKVSNDKFAKETIDRLDKFMSSKGLKDDNTIGDTIRITVNTLAKDPKHLGKYVDLGLFNAKLQYLISDYVLSGDTKRRDIKKYTDDTYQDKLNKNQLVQFNKDIGEFINYINGEYKQIIRPLELIIHDFGVKTLEGFQGSLQILNNETETKRIKKEVTIAIDAIKKLGDEKQQNKLINQLEKLKSVDNITTASEGFVFVYDGGMYKLTGNFAPINQLLGLFKYGGLDESLIKPVTGRTYDLGIVVGSFKPPHKGHWSMIESILDKTDMVEVYVGTGDRKSEDGSVYIDQKKSGKIWEMYIDKSGNGDKVKVYTPTISPVSMAYDRSKEFDGSIVFPVGGKGEDWTRFKSINLNKNNPHKKARDIMSVGENDEAFSISGTNTRNALSEASKTGNYESVRQYFPDFLNDGDIKEIANIVSSGVKENMSLGKIKLSKKELTEYVKGIINEAISDGDDNFRVRLAESLKSGQDNVKGSIREAVSKLEYSFKVQKAFEHFKDLLSESDRTADFKLKVLNGMMYLRLMEKQDPIPHRTTGINVLEDLLKKIIPIIEKDYKMLTTDKAQRDSYRTHIINALETVITSENLHDGIDLPKSFEDRISKPGESMNEPSEDPISIQEDVELDIDEPSMDPDPTMTEPGTTDDDKEKFIDVADLSQRSDMQQKKQKEDVEFKMFSISNHDETGRNVAFKTFKKIQSQISEQYNILVDERDRQLFFDYLLANVKLYFDRFEEELSMDLPEPTNDEYEDVKDDGDIGVGDPDMESNEIGDEEIVPDPLSDIPGV